MAVGAPFDEPTQQQRDDLSLLFETMFGESLPPGIRNMIQNVPNFLGIGNVMTAFLLGDEV